MTASFGCLDHAVLRLENGVNLLQLPNEQGKTTWSAFLLTMLYGLETRKRGEKARYQPWNGAPMEGTVTLEHQGQTLVLQRTSERGKPMGVFRAYDRDTGTVIPWLTGENCGEKLLGVPKSVFCRSAFLRGEELAVTQDGELAARLTNLAASGDGGDSYPEAEQRLKTWKNRIRYHKTGQLPEQENRLRQLEARLETVAELERQRLAAEQERQRLERELEQTADRLRREQEDRSRLTRDAMLQASVRLEQLTAKTAMLPERENLLRLAAKLEQNVPAQKQEPPCPPALAGLDAEAVLPRAQRDLANYEILTASTVRATGGPFLLLVLPVLAGTVCLALRQWLPGILCMAAGLAFGVQWLLRRRHNRQVEQRLDEAAALLAQYDAKSKEQLLETAVRRRDWLLWQQERDRQTWELEVLLEETAAFAPEAKTIRQAQQAVEAALSLQDRRLDAERELERVRRLAESGKQQPTQELHRMQLRCAELRAQAAALLEQIAQLGGRERLESERQTLERELEALRQKERALELALEALASAEQQMSRVYAPRLTGLAGERLTWLTGGHYDGLILKPGFELLVRERESGLTRPLTALSRGAQDQTWLALRLAMTELLLPPDAPLVLDDVLLTFDPARTAQAIAALKRTERQVLLFSCRPLG